MPDLANVPGTASFPTIPTSPNTLTIHLDMNYYLVNGSTAVFLQTGSHRNAGASEHKRRAGNAFGDCCALAVRCDAHRSIGAFLTSNKPIKDGQQSGGRDVLSPPSPCAAL